MSGPASPSSTSNSRDSPLLSPCRRGSVAAPDPFGTLLVHNNERGLSSTLTITKAPSNAQMQDVDSKTSRRRSTGYYNNPPSGCHRDNGRISFAFSTFSPILRDSAMGPRGTDDGSRPTSPFNPRVLPRSNSFTALEASLNPMQVYEVAQQCNYPHSQPSTPGGNMSIPSTPVSYTPLPATVYLPFLDRPREVEALISTPPTSTMFSLLSQTFPTSFDAEESTEPARWSYTKLKQWLTKVDRSEAEDLEWVQKARTCISTRSELIWERIKGALGVPPEFDVYPGETNDLGESGGSRLHSPLDGGKGADGDQGRFDDAWVEPIVSNLPVQPLSQSPTSECGHFPFLSRQNSARMQDIAEDAPVPDSVPASPPSNVHGLRIITSPLETASLPESSPTQASAGPFSHLQLPYDVVADRGPGNPLFPSSFANLALRPTLSANAALRPPTAPTLSSYPSLHATSRRRHRASSWADSWHPQKQAEYAASTAST